MFPSRKICAFGKLLQLTIKRFVPSPGVLFKNGNALQQCYESAMNDDFILL